MGDGEQQKGQIAEARRFAVKYGLNNLFDVIDRNHLQIGRFTNSVMPHMIRADYVAAQWNVLHVEDGHDFDSIFCALGRIYRQDVEDPINPTVLFAQTVMGKGVSFMENQPRFHGAVLKEEEAGRALQELGLHNPIPDFKEPRATLRFFADGFNQPTALPEIQIGTPKTYPVGFVTDNHSAYGAVLEDLALLNNTRDIPKILGFSCGLEGSVKMDKFRRVAENAFFESGIQEHHTATLAGALSREAFVPFFSTFAVFGVCETYNQHRLNDINETQVKLVCTHLGLDVGEDGQTHECLDYLGLLRNLYGFFIFMPADPNQTDRIIRYIAAAHGNFFVGMGRSKIQVILDESGKPAYAGDYVFRPGQADWLRRGTHGAILSYGTLLHEALRAGEELAREHDLTFSVLNMASIKPLDAAAVLEAAETGLLITFEDHHADTGLGALVANVLADAGLPCRLVRLGVKRYGSSGKPADLYRAEGIDSAGIVQKGVESREKGWTRA